MKLNRDTVCFTFGLASIGILMPLPAFAYIDPGTGSMILQLLLGGVAGALIVLKLYWQKLLSMFGLGSRTSQKDPLEAKDAPKEGPTDESQ